MKVIYVAGPYRSKLGMYYVERNIRKAADAALYVWRNGGVAHCPHMNTKFFDGAFGLKANIWIKGDLEIVRRCDAIWLIKDWENSKGAYREYKQALKYRISILFSRRDVLNFLRQGVENENCQTT